SKSAAIAVCVIVVICRCMVSARALTPARVVVPSALWLVRRRRRRSNADEYPCSDFANDLVSILFAKLERKEVLQVWQIRKKQQASRGGVNGNLSLAARRI